MLTADLPFHADTAFGYLSLHLTETPEPPSRRRPDLKIPRELERVILRCLEKDRDRRFPDARALAAAIERAVGTRAAAAAPAKIRSPKPPAAPTRAPEPPRSAPRPPEPTLRGEQRPSRAPRRGVAWPLASAVAVAAIVLGAGGYFAWRALAPDTSSRAPDTRIEADSQAASEAAAPPPSVPVEIPAPETVAVAPTPEPSAAVTEPEPALEAPPTSPTLDSLANPGNEPAPAPAPSEPAPVLARSEPAEPETPAVVAPAEPKRVEPAVPDRAPEKPAPVPAEPARIPDKPPARATSPAPAPAQAPAPTPKRTARTEPSRSATREPAKPTPVTPFANAKEMRAAYDDAVAFENSHDARAAIQHWKQFRARTPSRGFDELARRRITDLSLAQLQRIE